MWCPLNRSQQQQLLVLELFRLPIPSPAVVRAPEPPESAVRVDVLQEQLHVLPFPRTRRRVEVGATAETEEEKTGGVETEADPVAEEPRSGVRPFQLVHHQVPVVRPPFHTRVDEDRQLRVHLPHEPPQSQEVPGPRRAPLPSFLQDVALPGHLVWAPVPSRP